MHQTAVHMYILAALSTPFVVQTGLWEEDALHLKHPVLERHEFFALWVMWVSLVSLPLLWFIRTKSSQYFRIAFVLCLILMVSWVMTTGYYGGRLVYEYGVGMVK